MKGCALWLTGLSGSGKSTIANHVSQKLTLFGKNVEMLDGDKIRNTLSKGLGFSREDIIENNRRIIALTKTLVEKGNVVLIPTIAPFEETRILARNEIPNYLEIFVNCPLEECERRDVKGLYKKARQGQINNFIGIHVPYEAPKNPDLVIETHKQDLETAANMVLDLARKKQLI